MNVKDKNKKLIIFGAGGNAISVYNVAFSAGYQISYFIDKEKKEKNFLDIPILGELEEIKNFDEYEFALSFGSNFLRERVFNDIKSKYKFLKFPTLIHRTVVLSLGAKIGKGCIIMPNVVVGPNTTVGKFCILNTNSCLEHDNNMSDFSSVGPRVVTGGNVIIGSRSYIAIGAVIKNNTSIDNDSIIGSNSYLNKKVENNAIYYGSPAKFIRNRTKEENYIY
ncbi:MAG: UDP-N-acetylbacillosamine N-acetyltransferase [Alphaproteobacteria bacterium MarineAlpha2_Bin1]|nr:MAG: UDP-N-acetylbacillosamine N-acetyltransferase [Alphaproteobacteria bacterium MarineAlpha2_Bin1]